MSYTSSGALGTGMLLRAFPQAGVLATALIVCAFVDQMKMIVWKFLEI